MYEALKLKNKDSGFLFMNAFTCRVE